MDEDKGLFYCFGCKAGGDVFSFLERIEGLAFAEALERLAELTGVELPQKAVKRKDPTLYEINALALAFFREHLDARARAYLEGRGISPAMIETFQLGFAPDGWDHLTRHLRKAGVSLESAVAAGVLSEREGRIYDRFRNRLIVPILEPGGRVVGFSGRTLDPEGQPKYLNSPETEIFKKRELLFALPQAKSAIRERKRAIVVEGLFDVIALHQMGYQETVAVLGSALTPEQALLLKRLGTVDLYLAFDADEAGRKATLAGLDLEVARRFRVYAVVLPEGSDPGDLLTAEDGRARFEAALGRALPEVNFRFDEAARGRDLQTPEGKRAVLEALLPRLVDAEPFDPVAEALKAIIVDRLGLKPGVLEDLIQSRKRRRRAPLSTTEVRGISENQDQVLLLELDIVALLLSLPPEEIKTWARYVEDHTWPPESSFLAEFLRLAESLNYDPRRMQHRLTQMAVGGTLFERLMLAPSLASPELQRTLDKAMARLREAYYKARLRRLKEALHKNPTPPFCKRSRAYKRPSRPNAASIARSSEAFTRSALHRRTSKSDSAAAPLPGRRASCGHIQRTPRRA